MFSFNQVEPEDVVILQQQKLKHIEMSAESELLDLNLNGNPLAIVGRLHNQYLACLEGVTVTNVYDFSKGLSASACNFDTNSALISDDSVSFIKRNDELTKQILKASSIQESLDLANIYFPKEYSVFIRALDNILASDKSPKEIASDLMNLEARAVLTFGTTAKSSYDISLYAALSVARASQKYWTDDANGLAGTDDDRERFVGHRQLKPPKWVVVLAADIAGGIIGGYFGGPSLALDFAAFCSKLAREFYNR
jgi:hypothetical protein